MNVGIEFESSTKIYSSLESENLPSVTHQIRSARWFPWRLFHMPPASRSKAPATSAANWSWDITGDPCSFTTHSKWCHYNRTTWYPMIPTCIEYDLMTTTVALSSFGVHPHGWTWINVDDLRTSSVLPTPWCRTAIQPLLHQKNQKYMLILLEIKGGNQKSCTWS